MQSGAKEFVDLMTFLSNEIILVLNFLFFQLDIGVTTAVFNPLQELKKVHVRPVQTNEF